jgi:apolipoprotein N-acyltransferase
MPVREFFHLIVPDLVDLVTRDYSFGTRSNVLEVDGNRLAVSICFDIVDDDQTSTLVNNGASAIISMTNNADFGYTDESAQQLQIAKLRALESGLYMVNISTVGTSAVIDPRGNTVDELPAHTPGALTNDIPIARGGALGARMNMVIELVTSLVALLVCGYAIYAVFISKPRPRRARK